MVVVVINARDCWHDDEGEKVKEAVLVSVDDDGGWADDEPQDINSDVPTEEKVEAGALRLRFLAELRSRVRGGVRRSGSRLGSSECWSC